jgi:2-desacetyl-2-hydroxyethyl bacteriochlorophyllide A dehydrogenase
MRAVQRTAPGRLEMIEMPKPAPGPGQVLTRTALVSICGSDWPVALYGRPDVTYPLEPGRPCHEIVSVVESSDLAEFKPGDRVLSIAPPAYDGLREYHVRDRHEIITLPPDRPLEELVLTQPLGVVVRMCRKWPNILGWNAVVIGQGSIGMLFTLMLRQLGARRIITLDLEEYRLEVSRAIGATHTLNPEKDDAVQAVMDLTDGQGADMVVEAVGIEQTANLTISLVRRGGYITMYGIQKTSPVALDLISMVRREVTLLTTQAGDRDLDYGLARDLIADGRIALPRMITHKFPVTAIREAFELAHDCRDGVIKIGLQFDA